MAGPLVEAAGAAHGESSGLAIWVQVVAMRLTCPLALSGLMYPSEPPLHCPHSGHNCALKSQETACVPCWVWVWHREHLPTVTLRHSHEFDMVSSFSPNSPKFRDAFQPQARGLLLPHAHPLGLAWTPQLPPPQDSPISTFTFFFFRLLASWMDFLFLSASRSQPCVSRSQC